MMLAATPSVLVLSPSLVQHAYNPFSQLMPAYHPSLSYNPWPSPLSHRNPFGYATQVAMPRHSVLDGLLDNMMQLARRNNVFDDVMEKMVERVPTWKEDEEGGTVSTVLDVRGVPAESLSSELGADGNTLTIRGVTPTLRLEHSVALPTAADADKIALELTDDGRLLVRAEPPAPRPRRSRSSSAWWRRRRSAPSRRRTPPRSRPSSTRSLGGAVARGDGDVAEVEVAVEKAEAEAAA